MRLGEELDLRAAGRTRRARRKQGAGQQCARPRALDHRHSLTHFWPGFFSAGGAGLMTKWYGWGRAIVRCMPTIWPSLTSAWSPNAAVAGAFGRKTRV